MARFIRLFALIAVLFASIGIARAGDPEYTLYMDLPAGRVVIEMRPDLAPHHVARIKELVRRGFYDGMVFHRVIPGFMAQTGDPMGNGSGGSGRSLKAEFSAEHFGRGVVGMARSGDVNSGDSQFFIMTGDKDSLDGKYTVWGKVVSGMDYIDKLKAGTEENDGKVDHPDHINQIQVAADVDKPAPKS